jgi:hypothetical protein
MREMKKVNILLLLDLLVKKVRNLVQVWRLNDTKQAARV